MYVNDPAKPQKTKKLQIRDLITIGILNALFIVVFMVVGMICWMLPLTYIFMTTIVAVPTGIIFILMLTRIAKPGVFFVSGLIQIAVFMLMGSMLNLILSIIVAAVIAELVMMAGAYKRFWAMAAGFGILIAGYTVGALSPVVFITDSYMQRAAEFYGAGYIQELLSLVSVPLLVALTVVSFVGALAGAYLGKMLLIKHFFKAGVV